MRDWQNTRFGELHRAVLEMSRRSAIISGSYIFLVALWSLFTEWQTATWLDALVVGLLVSGWVILWSLRRSELERLVPWLPILLMIYVFLGPSQVGWPGMPSLSFVATIVAISRWGTSAAAITIVVCALATYWDGVFHQQATWLLPGQYLGGLLTTLVALTLPPAILLVKLMGEKAAKDADRLSEQILNESEASIQNAELEQARLATARRIHETHLNTLVALGDPYLPKEQLLSICRNVEGTSEQDSLSLEVRSLILEVIPTETDSAIDIDLEPGASFNNLLLARAFRDALVEALQNANRHGSGVTGLEFKIADGFVTAIVEDSGQGIEATTSYRFGFSKAIVHSLEVIGGSAEIKNRISGGTRVTLRAPLSSQQADGPILANWGALINPPKLRLGLLATIPPGLVSVPFTIPYFGIWPTVFFAGFTAVLVLMAIRSESWRLKDSALVVSAFALGCAALFSVDFEPLSCEAELPMQALMYSIAGGVTLPLLAIRSNSHRLAIAIAWFAVTMLAVSALPQTCQAAPLESAIQNIVWTTVILFLFVSLSKKFAAREQQLIQRWQSSTLARARELSDAEQRSELLHTTELVKMLAADFMSGRLEPRSAQALRKIAVLESGLRTRIGLIRIPDNQLRFSLMSSSDSLARNGWRLGVEIHENAFGANQLFAFLDALLREITVLDQTPGDLRAMVTASGIVLTTASQFADIIRPLCESMNLEFEVLGEADSLVGGSVLEVSLPLETH
ncbi:MAG: hypothetical protein EBS38_06610 [Actinobacteria bacterium]|nr:hypothetical protein [Actinomycetota bacterium]